MRFRIGLIAVQRWGDMMDAESYVVMSVIGYRVACQEGRDYFIGQSRTLPPSVETPV